MTNERVEEVFENVEHISYQKEPTGYNIEIGQRRLQVPMATNFEWRMEQPVKITHMYFGNETREYNDFSFKISFSLPCSVRIQNVDARCYLYVSQHTVGGSGKNIAK